MHYLWFDCETGGLDSDVHSLLTAYFIIYDENFNILDELDLKLKPNSGEIISTPEAMKVTGINLEEHLADPKTVTCSVGGKMLMDMLKKHKIPKKRKHYRPSGQNIGFDIDYIKKQLISKEDYGSLIHHRSVDTLAITTVLQDVGILPKDLGNLSSLVEYFGIPMGSAHEAKDDVIMTVKVYREITKLLDSLKKGAASSQPNKTNSLLEIIEL